MASANKKEKRQNKTKKPRIRLSPTTTDVPSRNLGYDHCTNLEIPVSSLDTSYFLHFLPYSICFNYLHRFPPTCCFNPFLSLHTHSPCLSWSPSLRCLNDCFASLPTSPPLNHPHIQPQGSFSKAALILHSLFKYANGF